jgi:O-antigen ligase
MPEGWAKKGITWLVVLASLEAAFCVFAFVANYHGPYGFGVAEIPSWSVLSGHSRVHGTFSGDLSTFESVRTSSNFLAAYLLITIPLSTGLVVVERGSARWAAAAGTLLQLVALYLTYTRAALIALAIAILVVGWLAGQRTLSFLAVVSGVCATLAIPTMRAKFLGEGQDRYALWWSGVKIAGEHPLAGVGDGRYMDLLFYNQRYHQTPFGWSTSTSHNSILLAAAHYGLLGGLVQLAIYAAMVYGALRVLRESTGAGRVMTLAVIGSLVGYLVQDQFTNLAFVPKVATQLWYLVGLVPLVPASFAESPKPVR